MLNEGPPVQPPLTGPYQVETLKTTMKAPTHFFKFIPPALNSNLSVPESFRKYLRNNTVFILRRGDREWTVKIGNDWVFGDGWAGFMRDNGVQDFDIVVFKHQGNMVFDTMVYDTTWCVREYPNPQVTKSFKRQKLDNALKRISKGKDTYINQSTKSLVKAEKTTVTDQNRHPKYFVGTLVQHRTSLKLCIPRNFGLANGLSSGEMILKNAEHEGSWTVKLKNNLGKHFSIQHGILEFCTAIGLEKGDSFRFELTHNGKNPVAVISRLQNPCFISTFTAHGIKRAYLNIPLPFARSNKLDTRNCEMLLMDEMKRSWQARLCNLGGHVHITRLHDMLVEEGLKEGDEFSLELVHNGKKPLMNFHRHG